MTGRCVINSLRLIVVVAGLLASIIYPMLTPAKAEASGGYPWSGAVCVATGAVSGRCANYEWIYNGQVRNPSTGNYYYRNCTDYAAWKLISAGVPSAKVVGLGSGGRWDDNGQAKGLVVNTLPAVGAVGVDERYGHVVYVENVTGTTITISEYNWGSTGSYGTRTGSASQLGLAKFVHFGIINTAQASSVSGSSGGVMSARFLGSDRRLQNQVMTSNQYIASFNTKHVLIMQPDGNLVQYGDGFRVLWHTGTHGNFGAYAVFQSDGNLVVYASNGRPLWASGVRPGADRVVLQEDGHLVTYAVSRPLWATGVTVPSYPRYHGGNQLIPVQVLAPNSYLRSTDGRYSLVMKDDGNLVLYSPGYRLLWSTRTSGNHGAYFAVQSDGNLVVYTANHRPIWASGMKTSPARLIVQDDGNLVQYSQISQPLWHTATHGML